MPKLVPLYVADLPPVYFRLVYSIPLPITWEGRLQLVYSMRGSTRYLINGQPLSISERQLILIPPNAIYGIQEADGLTAVFHLDVDDLCAKTPQFNLPNFQSQVFSDAQPLLALLSQTLREGINCASGVRHLVYLKNALEILSFLSTHGAEQAQDRLPPQTDAIMRSIAFITQHFRERIGLQDAAAAAGFSAPYFSSRFSALVGVPFSNFITVLRTREADLILQRGGTLTQAASGSGFSDTRSLTRAYIRRFGHRPQSGARSQTVQSPADPTAFETTPEGDQLFTQLLEQLYTPGSAHSVLRPVTLPDISIQSPGSTLSHSWQQTIVGGLAEKLLYADNQQALRDLQRAISFTHLVVRGILNDAMGVISSQSPTTYSFAAIDTVLDFVCSIGLTPVLPLGYMPSVLARSPDMRLHAGRSVCSLPANLASWCDLIRALLQHLLTRYGEKTLDSWTFCLWEQPDAWVPIEDMADYFALYSATWDLLRRYTHAPMHSPALRPPALSGAWAEAFYTLCRKHDKLPDGYRWDLRTQPEGTLSHTLTQLRAWHRAHHLSETHIAIEAWDTHLPEAHPYDTVAQGIHLVQQLLSGHALCIDIAWCAALDDSSEAIEAGGLFHSGRGLMAQKLLPKASYYALSLLSRLGERVLAAGDGYLVAAHHDQIQVLLYQHAHEPQLLALPLTQLPHTRYRLCRHRLNRHSGSSYDHYLAMGSRDDLTAEECAFLRQTSLPERFIETVTPLQGTLRLTVQLEPQELCLLELSPLPD